MKAADYARSLIRAHGKGYRDARDGRLLAANPYKRWEHRQAWEQGWLKWQQEDEG